MGTAISPGGTCLRGQSRLWSWRDRGKEGGYRQLRLRDRGRGERDGMPQLPVAGQAPMVGFVEGII